MHSCNHSPTSSSSATAHASAHTRRHTQWCSMACFSLSAWLHSSLMSLLWQTVFGLQWQSSQNETSHIKAKVSQVGMWQYERKWKTLNTVCMRLYVCILDVYIDCTVKLSTLHLDQVRPATWIGYIKSLRARGCSHKYMFTRSIATMHSEFLSRQPRRKKSTLP